MNPKLPCSLRMIVIIAAALVLLLHPGVILFSALSSAVEPPPLNYVVNFFTWTRYNPKETQKIDVVNSQLPSWYARRKTYIIIHGFLGSGNDDWIIKFKDALLARENCNVVAVDWSAGSSSVEYYMVQPRVSYTGEDVARLVKLLYSKGGLSQDDVHVIGHSLGAHIAGFTGKSLNGEIGRITGLDPAGLMYHNTDASKRLDKSDAAFVDVIHTHGCYAAITVWTDCFGINENLGHADFWVNGGEQQPTCVLGDGVKSVKDGSSCDHGMVYVYYIESIRYDTTSTRFLARPCESREQYKNDTCPCGYPPQYMGFNADSRGHGVYYLNTSINAPYALLDIGCPAGSFSAIEIAGLIMLSLLSVLVGLAVAMVMARHVEKRYGYSILGRWSSIFRFRVTENSTLLETNTTSTVCLVGKEGVGVAT